MFYDTLAMGKVTGFVVGNASGARDEADCVKFGVELNFDEPLVDVF